MYQLKQEWTKFFIKLLTEEYLDTDCGKFGFYFDIIFIDISEPWTIIYDKENGQETPYKLKKNKIYDYYEACKM